MIDFVTNPNAGDNNITLQGSFVEANPDTNIFYYALNGSVYDAGTIGENNTANPSNQNINLPSTLYGDDYFETIKVIHIDDFGNSGVNENSTTIYVSPYMPNAPTIDNITLNSLDVIINPNTNAPSTILYAIRENSGDYVQADGSLAATPIWQTYTTWGGISGITIIGLSINTQYTFRTIASNPNDASNSTTNSSSTTSAYTLIEAITSITFTSVDSIEAIMYCVPTPTNLTFGNSGIQFHRTDGDSSNWLQINDYTDNTLNANSRYNYKALFCILLVVVPLRMV